MQRLKPMTSEGRRAEKTLSENSRDIKRLNMSIGHLSMTELTKTHAYDYLEHGEREGRLQKPTRRLPSR